MSLKTSAEVAASSVTESVDFAIGATIVLSVRGEASVVGPSAVLPKTDYEGDHAYDGNSTLGFPSSASSGLRVGSIVSSGSQIRVEPHSEVALLFSNGTIATIGANTRMAIKQFQQESFGRYEGNFSRDEEVSSSKLLLDLEVGSLVVDVKKLKKTSNLEVLTSLGVAGVRGTIFKIHSLAESTKLSVLTGRVDFVPPQEKAIPTSANESLFLQADKEPQLGILADRDKESISKTVESARALAAGMDLNPLFKELDFNKHKVPFAADLKMVWVEPGTFFMGSPITETGRQAMEARHEVALSRGFYLGVHEVTQKQYEAVMKGTDGVQPPAGSPAKSIRWKEFPGTRPILARLNEGERNAGRLPRGWAYVLPTEAEWEYACRAGTVTVFSLGNALSAHEANFRGASPYGPEAKAGPSAVRTKPVGSYAPNPWGFYDMHGNVWEWTADWFGRYSLGQMSDPKGSASGLSRVKRGGSWFLPAAYLRCASRSGSPPVERSHDLGFRLAFKQVE